MRRMMDWVGGESWDICTHEHESRWHYHRLSTFGTCVLIDLDDAKLFV